MSSTKHRGKCPCTVRGTPYRPPTKAIQPGSGGAVCPLDSRPCEDQVPTQWNPLHGVFNRLSVFRSTLAHRLYCSQFTEGKTEARSM